MVLYSYKLVTSVGLYVLRCQNSEFIYLKYLNTLPLNQLEDLILESIAIYS
jgi:hypothetical protein